MLSSFAQLRQQLHQSGPRSAVVAAAQDEHTLQAVLAARRDGLIHPILVGPPDQLRPLLDRLGASVPEEDLVPAGTEAECAAGPWPWSARGGAVCSSRAVCPRVPCWGL